MAHLHYHRTVFKNGSGVASRRIAYITRTDDQRLNRSERKSQRQLEYIKGGREDVVFERTRNLPAWAAGDPHIYFQAAEKYEGVDRVCFEEWKITLPVELTRKQNIRLAQDLIRTIAGDRLPCTYAFHEPLTLDGARPQPHIHLLISARRNDGIVRSAETHFKRYNREHPERGGAEKDPAFWHHGAIKHHRMMIADVVNVHLERHGHRARVHPESLKVRGIDRQPEEKLLPSESRTYREKGIVGETMAQVLDIRQHRAKTWLTEQTNARLYWEQRKAFLGITRDMDPAHQLAHILLKRHGAVDRVPERYRTLVLDVDAPTRQSTPQRLQALAQRLPQLGRGRRPDYAHGRRLQVHLHDEEKGMGWG